MFDSLLQSGSYLGIIAFLILTGCGLPIPEEVPIIYAGVTSAKGVLDPFIAFGSCLIGALVGDAIMYAIGYHFGHRLLKDHPKIAHFLHAEREAKYEQMILRHGLKVLFLARFMVGVRGPVYLSAGIVRMPFRRFLLFDCLCATVVVGVFFLISYFLGPQVFDLIRDAELGLTIFITIVVAIVGLLFYIKLKKKRNRFEIVQAKRAHQASIRLKKSSVPADNRSQELHAHNSASGSINDNESSTESISDKPLES